MSKPRIYISSSDKGVNYARALQKCLYTSASVTLRNQGVMKIGNPVLSDLFKEEADFAIFIFHCEDKGNLKGDIIFEIGLFMGKIGIDKVFIAMPFKNSLPKSLLGITTGYYDVSERNLEAALGAFCSDVSDRIQNYNGVFTNIYESEKINRETITHEDSFSKPNHSQEYVIDLETVYEITILNKDGDAKIKKTNTFVPDEDVSDREHEFFSDVSAMESQGMELKSYDNNFKKLNVEFTSDFANRKRFKVIFPNILIKGTYYTYFYEFRWNKLFPNFEEYFFLTKNTDKIKVYLNVPINCSISPLWLMVVDKNDRRNKHRTDGLIQITAENSLDEYMTVAYEINQNVNLYSDLVIKWMYNWK